MYICPRDIMVLILAPKSNDKVIIGNRSFICQVYLLFFKVDPRDFSIFNLKARMLRESNPDMLIRDRSCC
ncbi:Uncharacterised protein [Mycobacteroides abscessus subsp. abscessus]|nr:Uncharacterised protein [Mycobacteroides abscessus subsp. abscessus]